MVHRAIAEVTGLARRFRNSALFLSCNRSEAVKKLEKSPKRKKYFLVIKHLRARISGVFNFFTASQ